MWRSWPCGGTFQVGAPQVRRLQGNNKHRKFKGQQAGQQGWSAGSVGKRRAVMKELTPNLFFIPIPKKDNAKECSDYCTTALISHDSKVMLKILQARLQAGSRKGRGTRDQIANICWIIEKAREFQKNIYFCFIDYAKAFDCVDHNKPENS